jgi:hypothetical protein
MRSKALAVRNTEAVAIGLAGKQRWDSDKWAQHCTDGRGELRQETEKLTV